MSHRWDGWLTWEVSYLWGGTSPNRPWYPQSGGVLGPEVVTERTHHPKVRICYPKPHRARWILQAPQNCWETFPDVGWRKSTKQKKSKQSSERHKFIKLAQSKGSNHAAKISEEDANKKQKKLTCVPSAWPWQWHELMQSHSGISQNHEVDLVDRLRRQRRPRSAQSKAKIWMLFCQTRYNKFLKTINVWSPRPQLITDQKTIRSTSTLIPLSLGNNDVKTTHHGVMHQNFQKQAWRRKNNSIW